jgi:hypothetical protein
VRRHAAAGAPLLAALALGGCSMVRGGAPLFPTTANVQRFDFERDTLHQPPDGFNARHGEWSVADSSTATSGTQVLVRSGEGSGVLTVNDAQGLSAAGAEVAVRVFLGSSGAGIACGSAGDVAGHILKVEPDASRMALYVKTADTTKLVDAKPAALAKGEWARIGIRCDSDGATGYLDGKPMVHDRSPSAAFDLALYTDPGVTAQFDDLSYWARK